MSRQLGSPPTYTYTFESVSELIRCKLLGSRKWGFKRWGLKQIQSFLSVLDFPGAPQTLRERLSGPISRDIAIVSLRYPLSRDNFSAIAAIPQEGAIPPLGAFFYADISVRYPMLQHIARYLCDTPGKQARNNFAILSLKVSRDMKSIATGPHRVHDREKDRQVRKRRKEPKRVDFQEGRPDTP